VGVGGNQQTNKRADWSETGSTSARVSVSALENAENGHNNINQLTTVELNRFSFHSQLIGRGAWKGGGRVGR